MKSLQLMQLLLSIVVLVLVSIQLVLTAALFILVLAGNPDANPLHNLSCCFVEKKPGLEGVWIMGGPYNQGKPCRIDRHNGQLLATNENGGVSRIQLLENNQISALNWENGMVGRVSRDCSRIDWANGTWWSRASDQKK
ncbi:MAG: hypothetical protein SFY92_07240 [Verrucomicrobiae bacterium]|nr:hypothetical protein [Verrucomicrobiae bacterium]